MSATASGAPESPHLGRAFQDHPHHRRSPWRAGCGESRTSGSEGGPEKPTSGNAGTALRSDPYTYLWTREGWLYLAIVLDTFSRRIVGWSLSESLERELATSALEKALEGRRPPPGLLHHTDRGSQYASGDYREILETAGVVFSMSRKGNCWDNAMAESFFATLKSELGRSFDSRAQARLEVFGYIEGFYNTHRLHSALGYTSPAVYEREHPTGLLDREAA